MWWLKKKIISWFGSKFENIKCDPIFKLELKVTELNRPNCYCGVILILYWIFILIIILGYINHNTKYTNLRSKVISKTINRVLLQLNHGQSEHFLILIMSISTIRMVFICCCNWQKDMIIKLYRNLVGYYKITWTLCRLNVRSY